MTTTFDRSREDVGNIIALEHVNLAIPDQQLATAFYIAGMGFTRDPFLFPGLENMWVNIGRSQCHLPSRGTQRLRGTIGIVTPDLKKLAQRLEKTAPRLKGTQFAFTIHAGHVDASCPWGNRFRCHAPSAQFGSMELGMPYVEFDVPLGSAEGIARFYREWIGAPAQLEQRAEGLFAVVNSGPEQKLLFRETAAPLPDYDNHHIQIYIADFSGPHARLLKHGLITEESNPHQYRFRDIVDPASGKVLYTVEHEVRSLTNPLYARPLINRNPDQSNNSYIRGQDGFRGTY
jgi:hypothetical protein